MVTLKHFYEKNWSKISLKKITKKTRKNEIKENLFKYSNITVVKKNKNFIVHILFEKETTEKI